MQTMAVPEELLRVNDLAGRLKIHPRTVRRMAREGSLPACKVGADWRFDWKAVLAYLTTSAGNAATRGSL